MRGGGMIMGGGDGKWGAMAGIEPDRGQRGMGRGDAKGAGTGARASARRDRRCGRSGDERLGVA
jgi:hypothetical protein